ncbi:hypothetical protein J7E81_02170 [Bacillus sp. ISL-18]|uniref:hypothetical protein n=1 Tax=Bacillus sp. ISL-18 TaxID=2819118 RepID=UPI001BE9A615|nr:hypothetical protein [Bacillus sp. ISL-18]MBT2654051.1 hypothetical protein [Bacillus sp. ISL-18]
MRFIDNKKTLSIFVERVFLYVRLHGYYLGGESPLQDWQFEKFIKDKIIKEKQKQYDKWLKLQ